MNVLYRAITLIACLASLYCQAQTNGSDTQAGTGTSYLDNPGGIKKGSFFITAYYQYSQFQKIKMISHTNHYSLSEGESSYDYTADDIAEYNDNFKTDYTNDLVGLRVGYQALKGLGVNVFIGVSHFEFRSWISDENTQSASDNYPALTFGGVVDYEKAVYKNLYVMGYCSINYITTSSVNTDNSSGEEVISSELKSLYYDINAGLSYKLGKFFPYAGLGFTQQFIHPVSTEQIETTDQNGNPVYNKTTFDSHFRGDAFYGFAGVEYWITPYLSVYARSTFINPVRATAGIKISI
jgi:hypothetical protein